MQDIIEILFALIAGLFWLFGSSFFKNRGEAEPYEPTPSRRDEESGQASSEDEVRQREIREAIRRKIAERRQQNDSRPVVIAETEAAYQEQQEASDKSEVYARSAERMAEEPYLSLENQSNAYEQEMQKRLQAIEATKRKAEALRQQVKQKTQDIYSTAQKKSAGQDDTIFSGSVRSVLKNPRAARAAFIYGEVLGRPISLRNSSGSELGV